MAFPLSLAPQSLVITFQRKECGGEGLWCSPLPAASQDEEGAIVMLKRHLRQQRTVEEYGRNIKQLAGRAQSLLSAGHPEGYVCLLGWHVSPELEVSRLPLSLLCLAPWVVSRSPTRQATETALV